MNRILARHLQWDEIAALLTAKNQRCVTAESCTGGMIASLITDIAGSSAWFDRGFVTYSNQAKQEMLGVPKALIDKHGAVSEPTVKAMAEGAILHSNGQHAISVSGIAGPTGGSQAKPVGTVCFGFAGGTLPTKTQTCYFKGDRASIRAQATQYALQGLLERLRLLS